MTNRPVGIKLVHADTQADMHNEANSRFSQFCERAYRQKATDNILYCDTAVQSQRTCFSFQALN